MKTLRQSLLVTVLFAPAALLAASFEGKVNFAMTSGREKTQQINYSIKGDKFRIDVPTQKGTGGMIVDPVKKETTMIMEEQKMYMVMAMKDVVAEGGEAKGSDAKLEKTGQTEKILGYLAEKFIATDKDTKTELWLAEGLGTFMSFNNSGPMGGGSRRGGGGGAAQSWERALAGKELFPLRVVSKDKNGKESFRMEATAISKETLSDSLFVPPAGYQKFDMGAMMKGMMPGGFPGSRN